MKNFTLLFLLLMSLTHADEFDMFDEIDKTEDTKAFKEDKSFVNARLKLSYQYNEETESDKKLYLNLNKNEKNYQVDIRIIGDEGDSSFNLKELYYKGKISEKNLFEIGRVNIKEGVARGFNPTDYFKGTTSLTLSTDPKERKDNRLGSLLIQDTMFFDNMTLKAIYSPKISVDSDKILSDKEHYGLYLDETNYRDRGSLYLGYSGFKDISSSMILHLNEDDLNIGLNLSYISGAWIFYSESSMKDEQFHQSTLGINYTSENSIVTSLEYIYNRDGLNGSEWDSWFRDIKINPPLAREFGELRAKVAREESIMSRDTLFLLSRVSDIETNLDASLMVWLNPYDKSTLSQVGLEYALQDDIQTNIYLRNYLGSDDTEYGSFADSYQILIEGEYYF